MGNVWWLVCWFCLRVRHENFSSYNPSLEYPKSVCKCEYNGTRRKPHDVTPEFWGVVTLAVFGTSFRTVSPRSSNVNITKVNGIGSHPHQKWPFGSVSVTLFALRNVAQRWLIVLFVISLLFAASEAQQCSMQRQAVVTFAVGNHGGTEPSNQRESYPSGTIASGGKIPLLWDSSHSQA